MEWILIILLGILIVLWQIGKILGGIEGAIDSSKSELSGLEERLEKIYRVLGGELKEREIKKKEYDELKNRLIEALLYRSEAKTREEAEKRADELFEEAEFEEEHSGFPFRFESSIEGMSMEKWVAASEVWLKHKNRYGHLLSKAREFIKEKSQVKEDDIEKALKTDYTGATWLLEQLEVEGKVKRVTETKYEDDWEHTNIKYWEVS